MSNTKGKGVKIARKPKTPEQVQEDYADVIPPPPRDIYESVARDLGFDPLKEKAARST